MKTTCCEKARTCAMLRWDDDGDGYGQPCWTMIVDITPDSPRGYDLECGRVDFCPFCGARLPYPEVNESGPPARGKR